MAARRRLTLRARTAPVVVSGNTPYIRQAQPWSAAGDNPGTTSMTMTVLAGSSLVAFVTDIDLNGTPAGSGAPSTITVTDTQSGTYANRGFVADQFEFDSLTTFVRTNVAAGSLTVTCTWSTNQWHGLMLAEIANVSATPTVSSTGQMTVNPTPHSADAISTGTLALGSSPAFLVALAYNATDITTSDGYPDAGTGFTPDITGWNWGGVETTSSNNVAQLESRYLANPGTVAATFTPRTPGPNPENFLAMVVAFQ